MCVNLIPFNIKDSRHVMHKWDAPFRYHPKGTLEHYSYLILSHQEYNLMQYECISVW
jgi:hypothetical protein